jgi:hypothetical protein
VLTKLEGDKKHLLMFYQKPPKLLRIVGERWLKQLRRWKVDRLLLLACVALARDQISSTIHDAAL